MPRGQYDRSNMIRARTEDAAPKDNIAAKHARLMESVGLESAPKPSVVPMDQQIAIVTALVESTIDSTMQAFRRLPSAEHFGSLDRAMWVYQYWRGKDDADRSIILVGIDAMHLGIASIFAELVRMAKTGD